MNSDLPFSGSLHMMSYEQSLLPSADPYLPRLSLACSLFPPYLISMAAQMEDSRAARGCGNHPGLNSDPNPFIHCMWSLSGDCLSEPQFPNL